MVTFRTQPEGNENKAAKVLYQWRDGSYPWGVRSPLSTPKCNVTVNILKAYCDSNTIL